MTSKTFSQKVTIITQRIKKITEQNICMRYKNYGKENMTTGIARILRRRTKTQYRSRDSAIGD